MSTWFIFTFRVLIPCIKLTESSWTFRQKLSQLLFSPFSWWFSSCHKFGHHHLSRRWILPCRIRTYSKHSHTRYSTHVKDTNTHNTFLQTLAFRFALTWWCMYEMRNEKPNFNLQIWRTKKTSDCTFKLEFKRNLNKTCECWNSENLDPLEFLRYTWKYTSI